MTHLSPSGIDSDPGTSVAVVPPLTERVPAQSVMAELLRAQVEVGTRTRLARLLGRSPLTDETHPWYRGALGELEVAQHLATLDGTWRVLHAVPVGAKDSDIDHVAIGPGGVFTLNTKNHSTQDLWVAGRTFMVNGQRVPHIRNSEHEAARAAKLLTAAIGKPVTARGVIVVVDPKKLTVREAPAAVDVVTAQGLVRWLQRQPAVLTPAEVEELAAAAARPENWHKAPRPGAAGHAVRDAFNQLHHEVVSARRLRTTWRLGLGAVGFAALATLGPDVVQHLATTLIPGVTP